MCGGFRRELERWYRSAFVAAAHVGSVFGGAGSVDGSESAGSEEAGSAFIAPRICLWDFVVVIAVGLL